MIYFQDLTREALADLLYPLCEGKGRGLSSEEREKKKRAQSRYRAKQLFQWVYQKGVTSWEEMTDVSQKTRLWLSENVEIYFPKEKVHQISTDGTMKFLWTLKDEKTIESVILPHALKEKGNDAFVEVNSDQCHAHETDVEIDSNQWSRLTACISSQVGCAMGCKFCLTGIQGLDRHLKTHEIVGQIHALRKIAPITNIVFMGMGEPLHNVDAVIDACKILLDSTGLHFSKRKITVSTSGLVPAIERLIGETDVSLAVSLNATTDEIRNQIMPVNKRWPLKDLMRCIRSLPLHRHRKVTFEYVLLKEINDSEEDIDRLIQLVKGIPALVNLIPFNAHSGSDFSRPNDEKVRRFQKRLMDEGVTATVRISRGRDILAACGQLRSLFGTARGTDRHRDFSVVTPGTSL
ncbi:MAG: 23S rRNA (adenine(2503)-C(2))-methyltransferase RlmN [Bdellovibrionaceae bacterium]|nr:23S rRNA (adenine(2503)-C(2))-methyltransferase RlmN [Pseudobdellovibrionaceae bacterium]|tara:strand:- start:3336 stop:4553 length:1218 start_codon:yes stop_codon:yes gene_type:complete